MANLQKIMLALDRGWQFLLLAAIALSALTGQFFFYAILLFILGVSQLGSALLWGILRPSSRVLLYFAAAASYCLFLWFSLQTRLDLPGWLEGGKEFAALFLLYFFPLVCGIIYFWKILPTEVETPEDPLV